jgi:uncharacterized coiled-coil DUF342 family protein
MSDYWDRKIERLRKEAELLRQENALYKKSNDELKETMGKKFEKLKEFQDSFLLDKDTAYANFYGPIKQSCQYDDDINLLNRQDSFREGYESALRDFLETQKAIKELHESRRGE